MNTTIDNDVTTPPSHKTVNVTAIRELPVLGAGGPLKGASSSTDVALPTPPFPRHPEKCGGVEPDPKFLPREGNPYRTRVTLPMIALALKGWLVPYLRSRVKPGDFHPIISYLFTEWKCNLDCHYCWAFDNRVKGMTEETARRSIDWLHDTGCRVLALMGGEVLLRPDFAHKVSDYAARKGFWVMSRRTGA
jgi:sulfatase maturation enzyme AslB (radical SAM superfamily)